MLQRQHSILKKHYLISGINFLKKILGYLSLLRIMEYEFYHMAMRVEESLVVPIDLFLLNTKVTELGTKMLPIVNSLADFGNYYKSIIEQNEVR